MRLSLPSLRSVLFTGLTSFATLACASSATTPCPSAPAAPAAATPTAAPVAAHAAECAVWNREVEFAKSVHDHDAKAFAEHVEAGAVFVNGDGPADVKRGRDAIVEGWKGIVRGDAIHLEWHPTSVVLTGDPHVAISRGPYWMEDVRPSAKQRFLTGVFQSIWIQDADGVWRVTVDGGTPPPAPATAEDVAKIRASIPAECPAG